MVKHEDFEELAALAAIGVITEAEYLELQIHLQECVSCRTAQADFAELIHEKLPAIEYRVRPRWSPKSLSSADAASRERFIERARSEGIRFSAEVYQETAQSKARLSAFPRPLTAFALVALFLLAAGLWIYQLNYPRAGGPTPDPVMLRRIAQLTDSDSQLRARLAEASESEGLEVAQIVQLKSGRLAGREQLAAVERSLQAAENETRLLRAQLEDANSRVAKLESQGNQDALLVLELKNQLEKTTSRLAETEAAAVDQQDRLRDLRAKFAAQTAVFDRERQLIAAGKEIRDLMGARNLHIIDVYDVDGNSKTGKKFGRVFYTEGKSLIFYAFDLAPHDRSRFTHSFQAWGSQEPERHAARNLGIFYADDETHNRWVLKFDDPEVIAQIDAVFVTVEPPGGSSKPTGRKLLYAYLNGQPNHP